MQGVPEPNQVTSTAFGPMFIVAVEQFTPVARRIVDDALARRFLPFSSQPIIAA
jgi:O-methyltransferase involved in polyketide biosynthesis